MNKLDTLIVSSSIEMAARWHGSQCDAGGVPYIYHPLAVGKALLDDGEPAIVVAAGNLHDVIEDTSCIFPDIEDNFSYARGFGDDSVGKEIAMLVDYLTHRKGREKYFDYINRVCENPDAVLIKIADIMHNLRGDRQHPDKIGLTKRYEKALDILHNCRNS